MRGFLIALAAAFALSASAPAQASVATSSSTPAMAAPTTVVYALMQQAPDKVIDINVSKGGGKWYANPVWIGIGAVAIIVVLLLVVLAARGGGTTIVKE